MAKWKPANTITTQPVKDEQQVSIPKPVNNALITKPVPTGYVPLRSTLENQGHSVGYDSKTGAVSVNNTPVDTSKFSLINDRYYGRQSDIDSLTSAIPKKTVNPVTSTSTAPSLDNLVSTLYNNTQPKPYTPMTYTMDEAYKQATAEIDPIYNQKKQELIQATQLDLEKRGISNSPLASNIVTEKLAQFENARQGDLQKRAGDIYNTRQGQYNTETGFNLQQEQTRNNALTTLMGVLQNQQGFKLSEAQMMGLYNGLKTLQAKQYDTNTAISEAGITGTYNGAPTIAKTAMDAQLTGTYNGTPTMAKTAMDAELTGKYNGENTFAANQADIGNKLATGQLMGIYDGQQTLGARTAADETEIARGRLTNEQNQTTNETNRIIAATNKENDVTSFNSAVKAWELSGKPSPKSPILEKYGINEGTVFPTDPTDKINTLKLAEETEKVNEVKKTKEGMVTINKTYGTTDENTAEATYNILNYTSTGKQARDKLLLNKDLLEKEGVNIAYLTAAINKKYPITEEEKASYTDYISEILTTLSGMFRGPQYGSVSKNGEGSW